MSLAHFTALQCRILIGRGLYGLMVLTWLVVGAGGPLVHAADRPEQMISQKPFMATNIEGMAVTRDSKGNPLAVTMPESINSLAQVVNLKTLQTVSVQELRTDGVQASGTAFVVLPNRHVLIGTTGGQVFQFNPDKLTFTEQTTPKGQKLEFLSATGDGETAYFAATMSQGHRYYAFQSATSSWKEGVSIPDATSGIAYRSGKVYTGNAAQGTITVTDTNSAAASTLPLPTSFISSPNAHVDGIYDGLLYFTLGLDTPQTIIYDIAKESILDQRPALGQLTGAFSRQIAPIAPVIPPNNAPTPSPPASVSQTSPSLDPKPSQSSSVPETTPPNTSQQSNAQVPATPRTAQVQTTVPPSPVTTQAQPQHTSVAQQPSSTAAQQSTLIPQSPTPAETRSKVFYGSLSQYDPATKTAKTLAAGQTLMPVKSNCWIDESRCVVYGKRGNLAIVNTLNRTIKVVAPSPLVSGSQDASALVVGGDDTLYGAAKTAGAGVLQVDDGKMMLNKIVAPPSGDVNSLIAVGELVIAGTSRGAVARYNPSIDTTTPAFDPLLSLGSGSIDAMVHVGEGVIAFAFNSGPRPEGSIGLFSARTGQLVASPQLVSPGQSVTGLAYANGIVYGGTSDGSLFRHDLKRKKTTVKAGVIGTNSPVSSIIAEANGRLYGVSGSMLFEADSSSLSMLRNSSHPGQDLIGSIIQGKYGIFAAVSGKIYALDTASFQTKHIASGTQVSVNSYGDLYYMRGGALYRLMAERQDTAPVTSAAGVSGDHHIDLVHWGIKIGAGTAAIGLALLVVPIFRLFHRRPTYSIQR